MQFHIDADDEFLRVHFWGRDEDRPRSDVCAEVLSESKRRGRMQILIELDQRFPLSPASQYELVSQLPQAGMTHEHSIALVHKTPTAQMANQFINVVADNRGLAVRNFWNIEEAKAWLRVRASGG